MDMRRSGLVEAIAGDAGPLAYLLSSPTPSSDLARLCEAAVAHRTSGMVILGAVLVLIAALHSARNGRRMGKTSGYNSTPS